MPLTNGHVILNFKINGYLKFYFFNGCNQLLTEGLEKSRNVPSPKKYCICLYSNMCYIIGSTRL